MILSIWAFILINQAHAICYSKNDIKTNVCSAICKSEGYDTGSYEPKHGTCLCGQRKKYSDVMDKALLLVPKRNQDYNPYESNYYSR